MSSFIGRERKTFVFFDSEDTIKSSDGKLSSRATAMRGMLPFSRKMFFVLDKDMNLDKEALREAISSEGELCFFGFTFLIYKILEKYKSNPEVKDIISAAKNPFVLHIGGWKKLQEFGVDKSDFNRELAAFLNTKEKKIMDIYGMTEQLGTIYPDCEFGYKHVPAYSDIIIRDFQTLKPVEGKAGFIQLLTPLPHSYPGISVISDDVGEIVMKDGCRCGRRGKAFLFRKRAEKAELKGCGDTLGERNV